MPGTSFLSVENFVRDAAGNPISPELDEATRLRHWKRVKDLDPKETDITGFCKVRTLPSDTFVIKPRGTEYLENSKNAKEHYVCFKDDRGQLVWILIGSFLAAGSSARVKVGWVLNPDYSGPRFGVLKIISNKNPKWESPKPKSLALLAKREHQTYCTLKKDFPDFQYVLFGSRYSRAKNLDKPNKVRVGESSFTAWMGEKFYLWLPYAGPDLYEIVQHANEMLPEQAFAIVMETTHQMVEQVEGLHQGECSHHDIKMENVAAVYDPTTKKLIVRLVDFGFSESPKSPHVFYDANSGLDRVTSTYTTPEQWAHYAKIFALLRNDPDRDPYHSLEHLLPCLHKSLSDELEALNKTQSNGAKPTQRIDGEHLSHILKKPDGLYDWKKIETFQVGYLVLLFLTQLFPDLQESIEKRLPTSKFSLLPPEFQERLETIMEIGLKLARLMPQDRMSLAEASQQLKANLDKFDAAFPDFDPDALYVGSASSNETVPMEEGDGSVSPLAVNEVINKGYIPSRGHSLSIGQQPTTVATSTPDRVSENALSSKQRFCLFGF